MPPTTEFYAILNLNKQDSTEKELSKKTLHVKSFLVTYTY